jgi:predicted nuclease of predicted toxin-antitoxin system
MTFWLDAHLDPDLAAWLGATFGVIAKSLDELGLRDAEDDELFETAKKFGKIVIVTKDYDLVDLVLRLGAPPQILWFSFGNMPTLQIQSKLRQSFPDALNLLKAGDALVEIA